MDTNGEKNLIKMHGGRQSKGKEGKIEHQRRKLKNYCDIHRHGVEFLVFFVIIDFNWKIITKPNF